MIQLEQLKNINPYLNGNASELEREIDLNLIDTCLVYDDKIEVVIEKEYLVNARERMKRKYENEGGYLKVEHKTSSESGEEAGLTTFTFWF